MKSRTRSTITALLLLATFFTVTLLLGPLMANAQETYRGEGKDQLVRAIDSAIARVIDSGEWRAIVNSDSVAGPLIINMADCYPRITDGEDIIYPFPQNPVGLLDHILTTKEITVGDYDVNDPFVPGTFHVFDTVNPALLRAIIDELGAGYGIPACVDEAPADGVCENDAIQIVPNYLWPPSSALMFAALNNGDHDINGFNAALGATVGVDGVEKRRRDIARFTCTVFGTNWYAHVRNDSSYTDLESLIADTTADLCVGQLSSRLSEDYFKNAASVAKQFTEDDLVVCSEGVRDGTFDIYLHFDPVPVSYPDPNDLRVIPLQIISGIPIWVAGEESCDGLDVCEGDLDANETVDADDVAKFLEDFGRNQFNNPCPACVNGW